MIVGAGLRACARLAAVGITVFPVLRKFLVYSEVVAQFEVWGIPWPGVAVLVAGVVQILALISIAVGLGGRIGASALALVMVVAMSTAGADFVNGIVFVSSIVIILLGTGRYSVWDPTVPELLRIVQRAPSGSM